MVIRRDMSFDGRNLGKTGEDIAVGFLESSGFKILECNWKCPLGEIDIIAEDGAEIVFVEVKTKGGSGFGSPEEMVNRKKQAKLIKLAQYYLKEKNLDVSFRFDVVAIEFEGERKIIKLTKNIIEE